jgi:protocatechuate 3,4-dioxygenase beta subunit
MRRLFVIQHVIILVAVFNVTDRKLRENLSEQTNCSTLEPGQKGFIQLVTNEEPGEPLVVYGKVIERQSNQPVRDASLFLYQTDSSGIYNASNAPEEQARIRGTVMTNENGCFKVKTILPGDYPGSKNSRHLHYRIDAAGHKQTTSTLFFKGFTNSKIATDGRFPILDITKRESGTWIGTINLTIERN